VADPKQDEGFKVVDRRLFTEEGELRKDALEREAREQAAPAQAQKAAAPPAPAAAEPPESRSFQVLVNFLAQNAAAMMGGMTDPRTGKPIVDLEGVREVIDMLDALREVTRGNLAKADQELLTDVTSGLKLHYMEISKAAAEAMAKKAATKK